MNCRMVVAWNRPGYRSLTHCMLGPLQALGKSRLTGWKVTLTLAVAQLTHWVLENVLRVWAAMGGRLLPTFPTRAVHAWPAVPSPTAAANRAVSWLAVQGP